MELEWAGIPAVHICHEVLSPAARAMASLSAMPDQEWLTVGPDHDIGGNWSDEEVHRLAKELAPSVARLLTAS